MPDTHAYYCQSDPDQNRAFRGWSLRPLPLDAVTLNRMADIELQHGHYHAADRLAWLAEGLRETAP